LKFPHHEDEIAQSEGALGHPVVSIWMTASSSPWPTPRWRRAPGMSCDPTRVCARGSGPKSHSASPPFSVETETGSAAQLGRAAPPPGPRGARERGSDYRGTALQGYGGVAAHQWHIDAGATLRRASAGG
jgi:hypothetical protein